MVKKKTPVAKAKRKQAAPPLIEMPRSRAHVPTASVPAPMPPWLGGLLLATLALFLMRVVYVQWLSPYGLGPDEAQYWHWSTRLDWSYLSKPPLVAWAIGMSTALLGKTMLGVKLFALLGQAAVSLLAAAMAHRLAPARREVAAWWAWGIFSTVPLVAAGGLLMSPDALLLPLWMAALYLLLTQLEAKRFGWGAWMGIGVLVGLAGLAKYTAAVFYPLVLVVALLAGQMRVLKGPHVYVAGVISLIMQAPVLWWNYTHGWVGLEHVLWQTDGGGDNRHGGLGTMLAFLGSQALVLGPVLFVGVLGCWGAGVLGWRRKSNTLQYALVLFTLPVFVVFLLQTLNAKVQPNWPLLGTIPALVLVAVLVAGAKRKWVSWLLAVGVALNLMVSVVLHDTFIPRMAGVEFRHKIDPTKDMRGVPELGQLVGALMTRLQPGSVVLSTRYQTTAQLAFHVPALGGQPVDVLYLNPGNKRATEYDLWEWPSIDDKLVLYVNEQNTLPEAVKNRFGHCEAWQTVVVESRGIETRRGYTWLCWQTMVAQAPRVVIPAKAGAEAQRRPPSVAKAIS